VEPGIWPDLPHRPVGLTARLVRFVEIGLVCFEHFVARCCIALEDEFAILAMNHSTIASGSGTDLMMRLPPSIMKVSLSKVRFPSLLWRLIRL
jgi:hypothetical protein